ncbi:hypothetical protein AB0L17_35555, partial [Streptomyces cellulosae]
MLGIAILVSGPGALVLLRRKMAVGLLPVLEDWAELRDLTYVLYLRPFDEDGALFRVRPLFGKGAWFSWFRIFHGGGVDDFLTGEERIVHLLRRFGRVVAVGRPGEPFPLPGATRLYLPSTNWKRGVGDAMRRARQVLIVAGIAGDPKRAEGTLWEYTEAVRLLPPCRLLLLVTDGDAYERFRRAADDYFARRAAELCREGGILPPPPALPPYSGPRLPQKPARRTPLLGVVRFGDDWTPELVCFDPAAERGATHRARLRATVRRQIDPLLERLERQLPGVAVRAGTVDHGPTARAFVGYAVLAVLFYYWKQQYYGWLPAETLAFSLCMGLFLLGFARTAVHVGRLGNFYPEVVFPEGGAPCGGRPDELTPLLPPSRAQQKEGPGRGADEGAASRADPRTGEARRWHTHNVGLVAALVVYGVGSGLLSIGEAAGIVGAALLASSVLYHLTKPLRLRTGPRSPADLARETPILYLRPFPDRGRPPVDTSLAEERELKALLKPYGAFVFAGRWDETAALTGSAVLPLPTEGWKHSVSEALPHARLVLIPTTSAGPETLWQLTEAVRLLPPSRLLLVLSSGEDSAREYNRFRLAAQKEFARRDRELRAVHGPAFTPPRLPALPHRPAGPGCRAGPAPRAVIRFGPDWSPRLLDLQPT